MSKITRLAEGKPCKVGLPCCNHRTDTTVAAHLRVLPYCGTGMKPPDFPWTAWACSACHDVLDGRAKRPDGWTRESVIAAHMLGCLRTWDEINKMGLVEVG